MDENDFLLVRRLLRERAGIALDPGKEYLVEARLAPLARREGLGTLTELFGKLRSLPYDGLHRKVLEAMVTTETSFFRDGAPFELLRRTVFPEILGRRLGDKRLTVWSAGCSTGQEIYSVAMLLREHFGGLPGWTPRLIASDMSREVLDRARAGLYSQLEVNRGLPASLLAAHFDRSGTEWRLSERVRAMVEFREINLCGDWGPMPAPDVVLLRNVMIYFAEDVKKSVLRRLRDLLDPEGYLFLGTAESTYGLDDGYERQASGGAVCYRRIGRGNPR